MERGVRVEAPGLDDGREHVEAGLRAFGVTDGDARLTVTTGDGARRPRTP